MVKNLKQICEYACLCVQGTDKTSYDSTTIHSRDPYFKDVEKAEMTVGLSCAMYTAQVKIQNQASGPYSLITQELSLVVRKGLVSIPQPSHLIMLVALLLAGRVITKQPRGMLASSGQGISKLGCYLGFQIWKKLGKHFLLTFHQLKAAEILQNAIFRSRQGNR